jgi:hypothetical protein
MGKLRIMKKNQLLGIQDWLEKNKEISLKDFTKIHYQLMNEYPMPSINIENYEEWKPGSSVIIQMKGIPAPKIDVFKGKFIESEDNNLNLTIYASFRTTKGTALKPLKKINNTQYSVLLPENIVNGLMCILFPVQENFGPSEIQNKLPRDIHNWIKISKHISRESLTEEDCQSLPTPFRNYRYMAATIPHLLRFNYFEEEENCYLCPYGAIKIAPDYCYIDPLICKGQKYSWIEEPNGRKRGPEEICWNCFNVSDRAVSSKCFCVTIRKVLHLNPDDPKQEVPCCGRCSIPNYCNNDAIKNSATDHFYTVDKKRCNGCMICYLNKLCGYNCGTGCTIDCSSDQYDFHFNYPLHDGQGGKYTKDIHNNYTMRMVAHIDVNLRLVLLKLKVLRYEDYLPRRDDAFFDLKDFLNLDLIIWGDKEEKIPISLEKNGIHKFKLKEIPFTRSIHFALFEKSGNLLGFSYCGSNFPIKSLGGKRYSNPTKLVDDGTFNFKTPLGIIQIDYLIK